MNRYESDLAIPKGWWRKAQGWRHPPASWSAPAPWRFPTARHRANNMKWPFHHCGRFRQDISLLASGVLPEPEREQLKIHLAECPDCRKRLAEIESVTTSLANWERDFDCIQPGLTVQTRWARAIQEAGRMEPIRQLAMNPKGGISMEKARLHPAHDPGKHPTSNTQHPTSSERSDAMAIREWFLDVIWPARRVWAGLAVVWVLICMGNLSLRDRSQPLARKASPPTQEMLMAFKDRQNTLAELLADHSVSGEAQRPKLFSPRPRTERVMALTT